MPQDDANVPPDGESSQHRFGRELIEILNEVRVALPGVQMLFGFLVMVPFTSRFAEVNAEQRLVFFGSFVATSIASTLLIAPSVYHRLHWRREIADKEQMLRVFNQLLVAGALFLAISMVCAIYFITNFLFHDWSAFFAAFIGGLIVLLWFVLPLARRRREVKQRPIARTGRGG